ncbi:MAG: MBL fold metallo-hydrolase [Eubacteriales bacterium]|nr:MBL fold metallo-hydrolase [Eubacteriales bacterium]
MKIIIYPETWRSANSYLILAEHNYLIDPSLGPDKIAAKVDYLIATHGHFDHIAACDEWREKADSKLFITVEDSAKLQDREANCSCLFCQPNTYQAAEHLIANEEILQFEATLRFKVLHTPGHTTGSICLLLESLYDQAAWQFEQASKTGSSQVEESQVNSGDSPDLVREQFQPIALFTGDTVFADSIGRMDLPSGDPSQMRESLQKFKAWTKNLPADLIVFPGHGRALKLGELLSQNPYL